MRIFLIIILLIFTSEASAEDWSNWMGFQCEEDDLGLTSTKYSNTKEFILLKRNLSKAYWEDKSLLFENCKDIELKIGCDSAENSRNYSIQIHRFTGDIFVLNKDNNDEAYFFNCSLVKQLF